VLIGGEAGIGKTTLAQALGCEAAQRGALVLTGRCYDLTETPPYGPWTDLFGEYAPTGGLPAPPAAFARHGALGAVASQEALFVGVRDVLVAVAAQRPLMLLLDDLHWADPASLDLLRYLARQFAALPLLALATYRSEELTRRQPLYHLLPLLVREARAERLALQLLDADAVRALVGARYHLPPADAGRLVAYLVERGAGNPFYLGELLRALEEERLLRPATDGWALGDLTRAGLPPLVRQVIDTRLARLGEAVRGLLEIAAVIGQDVPLALWAQVAERAEDALLEAIERATEARVLEEPSDATRARFAHALIRETLYAGVPPSRCRAWHRRVGEALAELPASDPDAVAYHFRQAGDPRAADWLLRAAERAQRAYAWVSAAERVETSLALLDGPGADAGKRGWLLFHLARLRRFADPRRGISDLEEVSRLAAEVGDQVLAAYALAQRGVLRFIVSEAGWGLVELEAGIRALDAFPAAAAMPMAPLDMPTVTGYRGALATGLARVGRYAEALALRRALASEEVDAPLAVAVGASAHGHEVEALAHAARGQPLEARAAFARARDAFRAIGHHYQVAIIALEELIEVVLPYHADRVAERRAMTAEAEAAWARASLVHADENPGLIRLPLLLLEGAWAEVRRLAQAVAEGPDVAEWPRLMVGDLGALAYEQGDPEMLGVLVQRALPGGPATRPGASPYRGALLLMRLAAAQALNTGDLPMARAWLQAYHRWLVWGGSVLGRAEVHLGWATYHRATGDPTLARDHATKALAHASEPRQPLPLLAAHRLLGELDTAGRFPAAAARLEQALALADDCAAPYARADLAGCGGAAPGGRR